ncbi:MAG: hypothetical protein HQL16_03915 [Candidatus Omnitrophica bacterium]|nr:hypothetical protein [Candidatus Omnitrophota bacterium]
MNLDPEKLAKTEIKYQIARTREDLEDSFSLVYKEYAQRKYIPQDFKSKMRLSLYNALPETTTFVGKHADKLIATVTLVPDSPLGIPMDKIYKTEVDTLRRKGLKVAEVSQLSIDGKLFPKGWFSMFNFNKLIFIFKLFKLVLDYALYETKIDELCIAVNPRHQYLYKFLFFEELGGLKDYGSVNKAPALAKHLNIRSAEQKTKQKQGVHKIFFGQKTDLKAFENKFILTAEELNYFFIKKSEIFLKAERDQLAQVLSFYPQEISSPIMEKMGKFHKS